MQEQTEPVKEGTSETIAKNLKIKRDLPVS